MTQQELAAAAGITQAALSRYEHGLRDPEDDALRRVADALGVTPSFLRDATRVRGAVAVEAHMRRRKTAKPSDWRRLEARLNMHRLHARRVFDEIAVRSEHRIPAFDPLEIDPASAALFVRMQWRMPIGPVRGLIRWVESAGCIVLQEDFGTAGVDGLSQWIDDVPIMLLNIHSPTDRKRLTIAHELGHLSLHTQDVVEEMEHQANAFAAEFLMPTEAIRPQLRNLSLGRLMDLKREWQVSMQAIIERAWGLKLITQAQRTNLYKGLSFRGWRSREPVSDELSSELPELPQSIGGALAAGGLSPSEIAHVVGLAGPDTAHPFMPRQTLRAL
jgi:Zn-dependent peptidase ImmA (M78 family)